ncbi:hypothetical protein [Microbacterium sp.]|uniref:hypothetical protein n=1 Tax=Microbacterium sp. TaxID=51671 RepID=UPI0039E3429F
MSENGDDAASEAAPPTEVVQTIQRRNWTLIIVGITAVIVGLVGLGWIAGAISNLLG